MRKGEGRELGAYKSNQPELADLIFRALGLKGQLPESIEREYYLNLTAEDLTQPEFYRARRKNYVNIGVPQTAAAALRNLWQLLPPPGNSGTLTVVERVIIAATTADQWRIGLVPPSATATTQGNSKTMDGRNPPGGGVGASASLFQIEQTAATVAGAGTMVVRVPAGTTFEVRGPWILGPGTSPALVVQQATVNLDGAVSFVWTERHATDSELQ